jgi:hypothetical protein
MHPPSRRHLLIMITGAIVAVAASPAWGDDFATASIAKSQPPVLGPPSQPMANRVESVVASPRFSDEYGGDVVEPDGTVTVYAKPAGLSDVRSALEGSLGPAARGAYAVAPVAHTLADLDELTLRISDDADTLASAGVRLVTWGADARSSKVRVSVTDFSTQVARVVTERYGDDWVDVVPWEGSLPKPVLNRYYDSAPYYNGDRILLDNQIKCTDSFAFIGIASNNTFNLTAGHCGGSSVWTNLNNRQKINDVSTHYYSNGGYDMESFRCNCRSSVWYEGPAIGTGNGSTHNVAGQCNCGQGAEVTFDGASTGEQFGATVQNAGVTCLVYPSDGWRTCDVNYATRSTPICDVGDSGGPVYQRSSNNWVYAVGMILASANSGRTCWYHPIGRMLSRVNGYLLTG